MSERRLRLANGLCCHLLHQPDVRDAAALLRVQAGSLDEPDRWPGLAHLLEHVLFCGSARFSGHHRLMPWVQQQGGEVNATTQLSRSAYFCQLPAAALAGGAERLCDMLAAPRLATAAIDQEIAAIDAEYRLLQQHAETLSKAALLDSLGGRFRRFRVGDRNVFGDNVTELQSALKAFHRRFYRAVNCTLWLQGPQSLNELERIARQSGTRLLAGGEPPGLTVPAPAADRMLQLAGEEHFWLTLLIKEKTAPFSDNVTLLRTFWLDEAPGSLLAQLRQQGLCDRLQVQWLWQDGEHGWLALCFSAARLTSAMAQRIEQCFWQHLAALQTTDLQQRQHYWQLAKQDFAALAPLAQLRARALGFAAESSLPQNFTAFVRTLSNAQTARLLTQQQLAAPGHICTQGFALAMAPWSGSASLPDERTQFHFYPTSQPAALPVPPPVAQTLLLIAPRQQQETLLLRPAFYHPLSDEQAQAWQRALRPVLAELRHGGGAGRWQQTQGAWQLVLDLPPVQSRALQSVHQTIQALNRSLKISPMMETQTIAIRQLLAALPGHLIVPAAEGNWLAAWCGQQQQWQRRAAHLLSDLHFRLATVTPPPRLQRGIAPVCCHSGEQALLVFMPLPHPDDLRLAALRALALILEPRFFQRLRVELRVGYVVSARYQRVADVDGLLLALQSPDTAWRTLLSHCKRFMREMMTALTQITPTLLAGWRASLLAQCDAKNNQEAALQALRQQHGLADLKRSAVESLTVPQLQQLHAQLLRERHRWRILIATDKA